MGFDSLIVTKSRVVTLARTHTCSYSRQRVDDKGLPEPNIPRSGERSYDLCVDEKGLPAPNIPRSGERSYTNHVLANVATGFHVLARVDKLRNEKSVRKFANAQTFIFDSVSTAYELFGTPLPNCARTCNTPFR